MASTRPAMSSSHSRFSICCCWRLWVLLGKLAFPNLRRHRDAELGVRLFAHQAETGFGIDVRSGVQEFLGPKGDAPIPRAPRKPNALIHQALADSQAAGGGLHV